MVGLPPSSFYKFVFSNVVVKSLAFSSLSPILTQDLLKLWTISIFYPTFDIWSTVMFIWVILWCMMVLHICQYFLHVSPYGHLLSASALESEFISRWPISYQNLHPDKYTASSFGACFLMKLLLLVWFFTYSLIDNRLIMQGLHSSLIYQLAFSYWTSEPLG